MRVLVDCRSIHPGRSLGIENFAYAIVAGLAPIVDEVILDVCGPDRTAYESQFKDLPGIQYVSDPVQGFFVRLHSRRGLFGAIARLLMRPLRLLGVDPRSRRGAWAARQSADVVFYPYHRDRLQHHRLPTVVTIHAVLPEYGESEMSTISEHVKKAAAITVSWPYPAQDLRDRFTGLHDKLFVIPYSALSNVDDSSKFAISSLGVSGDYYFYPAGFAKRKNHGTLMHAYARARVMAGTLPDLVLSGGRDGPEKSELVALAEQLGIADSVHFLGFVSADAISALYRHCHATLSASQWEAGMATLHEGLHFGKPAICPDIAPARSHAAMLDVDVAFFDPADPDDMARTICDFECSYAHYENSARTAMAAVRQFDGQYMGKRYAEVLAFAARRAARPVWHPMVMPGRGAP